MMANPTNALLAPRRIGVTGRVPRSKASDAFCAAIGKTLVARKAVIVTRGGMTIDDKPDRKGRVPVDKTVVDAALVALEQMNQPPEPWIETVLSEASGSTSGRTVFRVGTVTQAKGQTYEAERFAFVDRLDGLVGIGGRGGTEQALILALATERPILPVPIFDILGPDDGAGRVWSAHVADLRRRFGLTDADVSRWTQTPTAAKAAATVGRQMVERLLDSMQRRCFVVMPFHARHTAMYDFVIKPAITLLGDQPIRIDRAAIPGDVGRQIDAGIRSADYAIVVLDDLRPNVLYELGLAHGREKPTILMNRKGEFKDDAIPFDLTMHQRLEYDELDGSLPERLQRAIRALGHRSRAIR